MRKGSRHKAKGQTRAIHKAHARDVLLTVIARKLQTAIQLYLDGAFIPHVANRCTVAVLSACMYVGAAVCNAEYACTFRC